MRRRRAAVLPQARAWHRRRHYGRTPVTGRRRPGLCCRASTVPATAPPPPPSTRPHAPLACRCQGPGARPRRRKARSQPLQPLQPLQPWPSTARGSAAMQAAARAHATASLARACRRRADGADAGVYGPCHACRAHALAPGAPQLTLHNSQSTPEAPQLTLHYSQSTCR